MRQSLARNAVFSIAYQLLNVIFPLISAGYVARMISPEGVGKVAYAQTIVSYFVMFAALGIPSYGIREIARHRNETKAKDALFTELLILNGIATAVCLICYYFLVRFVFSSDIALYTVFGLELVFNFINIDWLYQGTEEYGYITLRSFFVKVISLLALFVFVKDKQDYVLYAAIHCMGIGCNYCFNIFQAGKKVRLTFCDLNLKRHVMPILWLMLSSVAGSLYNKVDITMLGAMASTESVAYYTNAHKLIGMVLALVTAVSGIFLPRLSYVYANDRKQYTQYLSAGLKMVLLLAVPACVGIILVAENAMATLFGEAFLAGAAVLRILAVFTIVKGAGDLLCYQAIISSGNERVLIKSRIAGGIVNIVLNTVLIPNYGQNGAAIASVVSELGVNGLLLRDSLSIAKIEIQTVFFTSIGLCTVMMGITAVSVQKRLGGGVISLCISVAAGITVYCIMLLITKNEMIMEITEKWKNILPGK